MTDTPMSAARRRELERHIDDAGGPGPCEPCRLGLREALASDALRAEQIERLGANLRDAIKVGGLNAQECQMILDELSSTDPSREDG